MSEGLDFLFFCLNCLFLLFIHTHANKYIRSLNRLDSINFYLFCSFNHLSAYLSSCTTKIFTMIFTIMLIIYVLKLGDYILFLLGGGCTCLRSRLTPDSVLSVTSSGLEGPSARIEPSLVECRVTILHTTLSLQSHTWDSLNLCIFLHF